MLAIFLLLSILFSFSAYQFYLFDKQRIKEDRYNEIAVVSALKLDQIYKWIKERKSDAFFFHSNPAFRIAVERLLADGRSAQARNELTSWVRPLYLNHPYKNILIISEKGEVVFSINTVNAGINYQYNNFAPQDSIFLSDMKKTDGSITMDLVAPLRTGLSGKKYFVLFLIDPYIDFYPLIQSWPTPSKTAETLILKVEGDSVVYINELRHMKNTAMELKVHKSSGVSAPKYVFQNKPGIAEGTDYRRKKVLLDVHKISGTPWYLASKIDEDEVFAALNYSARLSFLVALLLIASSGGGVYYFYQRNSMQQFNRIFREEREKLQAVARYETLTRNANDAILLADINGNIVEANFRAEELFGYNTGGLLGKNLAGLRTPEYAAKLGEHLRSAREDSGIRTLVEYKRNDGSIIIAEVSSKMIDSGGESYYLSIIRDITGSVADQMRIKKLSRFYQLLNEINELIIRESDELKLVQEICETAVESGNFKLVWIGREAEDQNIHILGSAGEALAYLKDIKVSTADIPTGRGPAGKAITEDRLVFSNNFDAGESSKPWHERAKEYSLRSVACFPINLFDRGRGVISFYSGERDFFYEEELKPLARLASNLTFALEKIYTYHQKMLTEELRRISEKNYETIARNIPNSDVYLFDENLIILLADGKEMNKFGILKSDFRGKKLSDLFEYIGLSAKVAALVSVLSGEEINEEFEYKGYYYRLRAIPIKDDSGKFHRGIAVFENITESKKAAKIIKESEAKYKDLVENLPDAVIQLDVYGKIVLANPAACKLFGFSLSEITGMRYSGLMPASVISERKKYQGILEDGDPANFEAKFKRRDGTEFYGEHTGKLISTGLFQAIIRDITERKESEEAIRIAYDRLQALFDSPGFYIGIIEVRNDDAYYIMANRAYANMLSHSPENLTGKSLRISMATDAQFKEWMGKVKLCLETNETVSFETQNLIMGQDVYYYTSLNRVGYPEEFPSVSFISFDISDKIRNEKEILYSRETLRSLAAHIQTTREDERLAIAREMHDELGQIMTAIKMDISYLLRGFSKLPAAEITEGLKRISGVTDRSIKSIRKLITQLRPEMLDNMGLFPSVEWLLKELKDRSGINFEFTHPTPPPELGGNLSLSLFRIIQESLTNINKHSEASLVTVSFNVTGGVLTLLIEDNGKGFNPENESGKGFGLIGMKERMYIYGGSVEIFSDKDSGTKIVVKAPIEV